MFKSHVLLCYAGDDDCPVCRFLDGWRDEETLLAVINVLDDALADERKHTRHLMQALQFHNKRDPEPLTNRPPEEE